ncbi:MAG: SWIB/MDM2 domain-containing protein [Pseudomonadota bacterium]
MAKQTGIQKKKRLTDALADLIKTDKEAPTQALKKVWVYIKKHDLQNPANRRQIICDEKLGEVLGVTKCSMFQIPKLLQPHFLND